MGLSGFGVKGAVDGFMNGVNFMNVQEDRQDKKTRRSMLDDERAANTTYNRGVDTRNFKTQQENRAEDIAYRDKKFEQSQQLLDLNSELKNLQMTATKDKTTMERGKYISKAMRNAMSSPDGTRLDEVSFLKLPHEEQIRRFDVIHEGMGWMANEGNFMKSYLGANPSGSINADKPVAGFSLMQSDQGKFGVLAHLNKKDGTTGILDHPNRADGQGSIIPAEVFSDMAWQASGVFLDNKMTEREKLGIQNTQSTELENTKHKNRMTEQAAKPQSKPDMQRNMEYLIESGVAKNPVQARKMMLQAKSNPIKIIGDMVKSSEENQMMFNIRPGDARYRSREQMITEAFGLIDQINGRSAPQQIQQAPNQQLQQPEQQQAAQPQQAETLPPEAAARLQEGGSTTFGNGQIWTLQGGKPVRLK